MANKRKSATKKSKQAAEGQNGGVVSLTKELFQAAITLRGSVEPADYKRYVLPIIFCGFSRCGTTAGARSSRRSSQTRRATTSATRRRSTILTSIVASVRS
jgi:hypothetical protein